MKILISDDAASATDKLRELLVQVRNRLLGPIGHDDNGANRRLITFSCAIPAPAPGKGEACETPSCPELDIGDQKELAATVLDALGQALVNRGGVAEGKILINQALQMRREFLGGNHPATAASLNSSARVARNEGRFVVGEELAREALAINRAAFGPDSYPVAQSLNELARIQLQKSELDQAEASASEGLQIVEALNLELKDLIVSRLLDTLGRIAQLRGEFGAASEFYTRALAFDRRQLDENHPEYLTHLTNYATVKEAQGNLAEAEAAYRKLSKLYKEELNLPKHHNRIDALANLGAVLTARGNYAEAEATLDEALHLNEEVRGALHYLVGNDHMNLGRLAFQRTDGQDLARSLSHIDTALLIYESNDRSANAPDWLPAIHGYIAEALTWKGRVLLEMPDKLPDASAALKRALTIWDAELGLHSLPAGIASAYLGRVLYRQDTSSAEARQLLKKGYRIVAASRGADSDLARRIKDWLREACPGEESDPCD